jgi:enamine deaminase RidA (YjgF/YER057c/UK114 family)
MVKRLVNPDSLPPPRGYSNGVLSGNTLYVAGQPAYEGREPVIRAAGIAAQFEQALKNVLEVVRAAGGRPEHVVRMLVFVKDLPGYKARLKEIGEAYRRHMGKEFPAMAVVEVRDLFDDGALVEIEATAHLDAV